MNADRAGAREAFAQVLIAHGEAEEEKVYTRLRTQNAIDSEEAEHGEHEHAEINQALLALLQCATSSAWPSSRPVARTWTPAVGRWRTWRRS